MSAMLALRPSSVLPRGVACRMPRARTRAVIVRAAIDISDSEGLQLAALAVLTAGAGLARALHL